MKNGDEDDMNMSYIKETTKAEEVADQAQQALDLCVAIAKNSSERADQASADNINTPEKMEQACKDTFSALTQFTKLKTDTSMRKSVGEVGGTSRVAIAFRAPVDNPAAYERFADFMRGRMFINVPRNLEIGTVPNEYKHMADGLNTREKFLKMLEADGITSMRAEANWSVVPGNEEATKLRARIATEPVYAMISKNIGHGKDVGPMPTFDSVDEAMWDAQYANFYKFARVLHNLQILSTEFWMNVLNGTGSDLTGEGHNPLAWYVRDDKVFALTNETKGSFHPFTKEAVLNACDTAPANSPSEVHPIVMVKRVATVDGNSKDKKYKFTPLSGGKDGHVDTETLFKMVGFDGEPVTLDKGEVKAIKASGEGQA